MNLPLLASLLNQIPTCQQIYDLLPNLKLVPLDEVTLLVVAVGDSSLKNILKEFLISFGIVSQRLLKLPSHDALFLLRLSLSTPKLLHTLRTSPFLPTLPCLRTLTAFS